MIARGTRVAFDQGITSQLMRQHADKRKRGDHDLGHYHCRNLCRGNLPYSFGMVAGVMNSQVQHGREEYAAYLRYTPLDILTVPYRDRLSSMATQVHYERNLHTDIPNTIRIGQIPLDRIPTDERALDR